jgi:hypothetical protein
MTIRGIIAGVGAVGEAMLSIMLTSKLSLLWSARNGVAVGVDSASDRGVDVAGLTLRGGRLEGVTD